MSWFKSFAVSYINQMKQARHAGVLSRGMIYLTKNKSLVSIESGLFQIILIAWKRFSQKGAWRRFSQKGAPPFLEVQISIFYKQLEGLALLIRSVFSGTEDFLYVYWFLKIGRCGQ